MFRKIVLPGRYHVIKKEAAIKEREWNRKGEVSKPTSLKLYRSAEPKGNSNPSEPTRTKWWI